MNNREIVNDKKLKKLLKIKTAQKVIEMYMSGKIWLEKNQIDYLLDLREEQREYEERKNEKIN